MEKNERPDSLTFTGDDGEEILFTILADTRINGRNYLLVTDRPDDEECEVYILKENIEESPDHGTEAASESESVYTILEDENELDIVAKVFEEDTELSIERSFFE